MTKQQNTGKESLLSTVTPSKAITRLAIPATLALLAKAVYNLVDTAYIGMLRDDIALSAVGVTLPLLLIMVSIENIFAAGASVLAGRQLGADDKESANRTITTIVGSSLFVGIFLCIVGILLSNLFFDHSALRIPCFHRQKSMHSGCLLRHCLICRRRV